MSMKLSADLFNQITSTLRSDVHKVKGSEKRAQGRVGLRCSMELTPCVFSDSGSPRLMVWVRDISATGIGFVSAKPVGSDVEFIAQFERQGEGPLAVLYKVRHVRKISTDLWSVGASFERIIPDMQSAIASAKSKARPAAAKPTKVA
jgi:hypothetical protein